MSGGLKDKAAKFQEPLSPNSTCPLFWKGLLPGAWGPLNNANGTGVIFGTVLR